MRNLLALLGAAVLTFAGAGWYLGWYSFAEAPNPSPGHQNVTIDIDAKKIDADVRQGEKKVQAALERAAHPDTAKGTAKSSQ
jgi:hypothetical protein